MDLKTFSVEVFYLVLILLLSTAVVVVNVSLISRLRIDRLSEELSLPVVILQDVLQDVRPVVSRAVPPEVDARLRPADHLRRHRLVRLARVGLEGDGVGSAALERVVERVDADVVLRARPQVGQATLDGVAGED